MKRKIPENNSSGAGVSHLNGLSIQQRRDFYEKHLSGATRFIQPDCIRGIRPEELQELTNTSQRNGRWYHDRLECCQMNLATATNGHIQKQIRLAAGEAQTKFWTHHIGYATKTEDVLPLDLGRGSSIDHLCGGKGCHRPEHLELATQHADNVHRIGCLGVGLTVYRKRILHENPCRHATGATLEQQINTSCCRVAVVELSLEQVLVAYELAKEELNEMCESLDD